MQEAQINNLPIKKSSEIRMLSMPTRIEEIKPVVLVK